MNVRRASRFPFLKGLYEAVRFVALGAILFVLYRRVAEDWEVAQSLQFRWTVFDLSAALTTGLVSYPLLVAAWIVLLKHQSFFKNDYLPYYFRAWLISYLYRYAPGKWFLVTERVRLGHQLGIPVSTGAFVTACETLFVLSAAAVESVYVAPAVLGDVGLPWSWLTALFVAVVYLGLPLSLRHLHKLPCLGTRIAVPAAKPMGAKVVWSVTSIYLAFWTVLGSSLFFFIRMFHPLEFTFLPYVCGVFALSYALGLAAVFAPAGLGVREAGLAVGLSSVLPGSTATALALASRLWFTILELALLVFVMVTVRKPQMDNMRTLHTT